MNDKIRWGIISFYMSPDDNAGKDSGTVSKSVYQNILLLFYLLKYWKKMKWAFQNYPFQINGILKINSNYRYKILKFRIRLYNSNIFEYLILE